LLILLSAGNLRGGGDYAIYKYMQTVKELMTQKPISVHADTPLIEAANILLKHNFNGLPVVDKQDKLVGLMTEYDLVLKGTSMHLPTFIKLFQQFKIYKKDAGDVNDEVKKILSMKVEDIMNKDPFTISPGSSVKEAVFIFSEHEKINPIPVVDENQKLVGILARFDLIKLFKSPSVDMVNTSQPENVNKFIGDFRKNFVFVSKTRVRWWLVASVLFAVIGFVIAFLIILRLA